MLESAIGFIIGLVLGSFAKATADRMIYNKSLKGRSYCPNCKESLRWYDLFPVFSYFLLKGRCRYCKEKISIDNLLTEFIVGIIIAFIFFLTFQNSTDFAWVFNYQTVNTLLDLGFKSFVVVILAVVFIVDLKTGLIHDRITYPAVLSTVVFLVVSSIFKSWVFYQTLLQSTLGPYLLPPRSSYLYDHLLRIWNPVFWSVAAAITTSAIFILLIVITRGRGMGWGDVKYVFFLGLVLGFPNIIVGIFLAFLTGAIFSLLLIAFGKKHFGQTIPFGPFLSIGALIALIWGSQLINWYLNSFRF